jgi:hypothetical protein
VIVRFVTAVAAAIVVLFLCAQIFVNLRMFWYGLKKGLKKRDERIVVRSKRASKKQD